MNPKQLTRDLVLSGGGAIDTECHLIVNEHRFHETNFSWQFLHNSSILVAAEYQALVLPHIPVRRTQSLMFELICLVWSSLNPNHLMGVC